MYTSEQPKLNDSEAENKPTSGEQRNYAANFRCQESIRVAAPAPELDDPDEVRAGGDVDFGQLLDQFEQEQATLEEGEVVRGNSSRY
jgi:hypothetical protein